MKPASRSTVSCFAVRFSVRFRVRENKKREQNYHKTLHDAPLPNGSIREPGRESTERTK